MNRFIASLVVLVVATAGTAYALYSVSNKGEWPATWPKELEPLRKQSRTLVGPMAAHRHYAIRFATRDEMEAAWPHILAIKTKGSPIVLKKGENFFLGEKVKAGVVVHCPPLGQEKNPLTPEAPIDGVKDPILKWMNTSYIELIVDGEIVDLNCLPLPDDTPIIDRRFEPKK